MADYTQQTGTNGQLIIRDGGVHVQAIISSNYAGMYANGKSWNITVGAGSAAGSFSISGIQQVVVWEGDINDTTNISFTMGATNTQTLGGPTTLNVTITRSSGASVPGAPTAGSNSSITKNSFVHSFGAPGSNGGASINQYQVQVSPNSSFTATTTLTVTSPSAKFTGLSSDTRYYVRARAHNSVGWGPWSSITSIVTLDDLSVPTAPGAGSNDNITQTSFRHVFTAPSNNGGAAIDQYQVQRSTTSDFAATLTLTTSALSATFTGVGAGTHVYVRTRAHNSQGWGPWSAVTQFDLIAGAYVKVAGVQRRAVPYVKVAGEWHLAQPYTKIAGTWRQTT